MILQILLLVGGFGALYFGADWMVRGAARLEGSLGLSPIVIGLTVVSLGTSAPELVVAVLATLQGSGDLAVGNVLGSNLANIGLILGATALVMPLIVVERVVRREIPIMLFVTLLLYPLIMDMEVGRLDGAVLCLILAFYLTYVFHRGKKAPAKLMTEYTQLAADTRARTMRAVMMDLGLLVAGALGLVLGGKAIVVAATFLAGALGVTELVIGLTVVAIGTSLPELATSIMAAARRQTDLAVGNVIGSNIFNIAGVLGVAGMVKPISVDSGVLWVEFPAVLALSILVLLIPIFPLARGQYRIRRWEGAILLGSYVALGWWVLGS
ncbi:calcium/sodium antiporter [Gemmatimonadota bacterium]